MARPKSKPTSKSKSARAPAAGGNRVSQTHVQRDDPAAAADVIVTPARIAALRTRLLPIRAEELAALDETHTPAECAAAGAETQSANVEHDGLRYLLIAEEDLRQYPDSSGCEPLYLSYVNHWLEALESARVGRSTAAPGDLISLRKKSEQGARGVRGELLRVLRLVAGGDAAARGEVDKAAGSADTGAEVLASLGKLIPIGQRWAREREGARAVRARTFKLSDALLDRATRAHHALAESSGDALGANKSERDTPAVNLAEGRVLYAMKVLYETFETAHASDPLVRRLVPGPGTRGFITGHVHGKAGGAEQPPTATSSTTG